MGSATEPGEAGSSPWRERGLRVLVALVVLVILGGCMPYFEALLDANERPRLLSAVALVEEGRWRVDGPLTAHVPPGPDVARAVDGSLVPNKPPGATLVAALAYGLLKLRGAVDLRSFTVLTRVLGGLLPTLILALSLWRHERAWARALAKPGQGRRAAARVDLAVLAWLLATPAWANAKLCFGHALSACALGCGLIVLVGPPRPEGQGEGEGSTARAAGRAALGGLLAGSAILAEYTAAFAGVAIGAWLLVRERRRPAVLGAALAGALVPVLALAAYHDAVFGGPLVTGYHRADHAEFAAIHNRGLLGLQLPTATSLYEHLISPWGGLLAWAPLCVLGLLGGVHGSRGEPSAERSRQRLFLAVAASLLVVLVGLEQGGGWRVGPRYYVLAMALCAPGLRALLAALSAPEPALSPVTRTLGLGLLLGLFGASAVANFLAANYFPHLIPHGNPLGDLLWPLALSGRAPWGLPPALVGAAALGLAGATLWRWRRSEVELGLGVWLVGGGLALALALAQATLPASDIDHALELETVERIWEPSPDAPPPASPVFDELTREL